MHRRRTARAAAIYLILWCATSYGQSGSSAVGIISQASGEVLIERGQGKSAARLADLLYPGDKITTETGHVTFVYCPSAEKIILPDHTSVDLRADGMKLLKGTPSSRVPAKCLLPRVALGSESMERMGALRARGELPVALYLGGSVASDRPDFCWGPIKDTAVYRLTLRVRASGAVVWETSTSSLNVPYPESRPSLDEKQYEWEVRAEVGSRTLARGTAVFEVSPDKTLSPSSDASSEGRLLRAISMENEGYYSEAASIYRDLRASSPEDDRLTRHLAWLYWNAGLSVAANEELRRLTATGVR